MPIRRRVNKTSKSASLAACRVARSWVHICKKRLPLLVCPIYTRLFRSRRRILKSKIVVEALNRLNKPSTCYPAKRPEIKETARVSERNTRCRSTVSASLTVWRIVLGHCFALLTDYITEDRETDKRPIP